MKRAFICLLFLLILMLSWAMPALGQSAEQPLYLPGIVKLQLSNMANELTTLPKTYNASTGEFGIPELDLIFKDLEGTKIIRAHRPLKNRHWEEEMGFNRWVLVHYKKDVSVDDAIKEFKKSGHIQDASPEFLAYPALVPNDEYYPWHWGHNNTAQLPGTCDANGNHSGAGVGLPGFDVRSEQAWDDIQGFGIPQIVIAIIDSGVDWGHPDLLLVPGYDFGDNDDNPQDNANGTGRGHGTSTAGIAAGRGNNEIGVVGIAGGCSIMPLKMLDSQGNFSYTSMENCLTYAADNGARVVSMSFGSTIYPGLSPASDAALVYAYTNGLVLCAATGNDNNSSIFYPANHPNVISVGAASPCGRRKSPTTCDGDVRWGSNYGAITQDSNFAIDILAPTTLPSTDIRGALGYSPEDYYMWFSGTSCSSPFLAGVAALVLSKNPDLSNQQVKNVITSTATDMTLDGGVGWDRFTGYGLVNAYAALTAVPGGNPYLVISEPDNNSTFDLGEVVPITVEAVATQGEITQVHFFAGDMQQALFVDTAFPWTWNLDTDQFGHGELIVRVRAYSSNGNSSSRDVKILIRHPAEEGFESGNFQALPWVHSETGNWSVVSAVQYTGAYSARSAGIGANQSSSVSLNLDVSEPSAISFFIKVSSHHQSGFLKFYINDVLQGQWSGNVNWSWISYPVGMGQNSLRWTYNKTSNLVSGSDCAWLDHIMLPVYNRVFMPPQNPVATAGTGLITLAWQGPQYGFPDGYCIYRNGSYFDFVSSTTYVDRQVLEGIRYRYTITALYNQTESVPSAEVTAIPLFAGTYISIDNNSLAATLLWGETASEGLYISNLGNVALSVALQFLEGQPEWISISPQSANISPGMHQQVDVWFETQNAEPGIHYASLQIVSNDHNQQLLEVYIVLEVIMAMLERPIVSISNDASGLVQLSWQAIPGAICYLIFSSNYPDGEFTLEDTSDAPLWEDTGSVSLGRRFYRVVAVSE